jgi:hypothetical protein
VILTSVEGHKSEIHGLFANQNCPSKTVVRLHHKQFFVNFFSTHN